LWKHKQSNCVFDKTYRKRKGIKDRRYWECKDWDIGKSQRNSDQRSDLSHLTVERTAEILCEIKAIPVKSPLNIVYRSESVEAERILNEMGIKQPDRILVGALPKSD
jgi:hypothetical protein